MARTLAVAVLVLVTPLMAGCLDAVREDLGASSFADGGGPGSRSTHFQLAPAGSDGARRSNMYQGKTPGTLGVRATSASGTFGVAIQTGNDCISFSNAAPTAYVAGTNHVGRDASLTFDVGRGVVFCLTYWNPGRAPVEVDETLTAEG